MRTWDTDPCTVHRTHYLTWTSKFCIEMCHTSGSRAPQTSFLAIFPLKKGPMALFTHLKIILL